MALFHFGCITCSYSGLIAEQMHVVYCNHQISRLLKKHFSLTTPGLRMEGLRTTGLQRATESHLLVRSLYTDRAFVHGWLVR